MVWPVTHRDFLTADFGNGVLRDDILRDDILRDDILRDETAQLRGFNRGSYGPKYVVP